MKCETKKLCIYLKIFRDGCPFAKQCANFIQGDEASDSSQVAGYVPLPQCATQDNKGNHCPEKPTRDAIAITTGRHVRVCEKCFKNWSDQGIIKAHNEKDEVQNEV